MPPVRLAIVVIALSGCVHQDQTVDTYFPEPTIVAGPPGGGMDSSWNAAYPAGDSGNPAAYGDLVASADPSDPGYVMGTVTDAEIDYTLEGYGEWVEIDGYGEVWRPYATEVGLDFTPYETCGSWVWTDDWGWVYGCDWEWGWLPFHYGQWGWFDDYWAWVPDYEWSPAWVEWRGGGGYVGWRPQAPVVRDHRHHHQGPVVRDHRTNRGGQSVPRVATLNKSHWRFAAEAEFGKRNIRAHLFKNPAEGLRLTQITTRPPLRGSVQPVKAASIMQGRLATLDRANNGRRNVGVRPAALDGAYVRGIAPGRVTDAPTRRTQSFGADESDDNAGVFAPGAAGTEGSPVRGGTSGAPLEDAFESDGRSGGPGNNLDPATPATPQPDPSRWEPVTQNPAYDTSTWQPATPAQPSRNRHSSDSSTWQPAQPAQPSRDSWNRPSRDSSTWQPAQPSRPTWTPPPSRPSSSWQPAQPSRPSQPSSSWQPAQSSQPSSPRPTWTPPPSRPSSSWQPATSSSSSRPSQPSHSSSSSSSSSWSRPSSSSSSSSRPSSSSSSSSHSAPPSSSAGSRASSGGHRR
jgi:hypothetical protein